MRIYGADSILLIVYSPFQVDEFAAAITCAVSSSGNHTEAERNAHNRIKGKLHMPFKNIGGGSFLPGLPSNEIGMWDILSL